MADCEVYRTNAARRAGLPTIATTVWEPDPERPPYLRLKRRKRAQEVREELVAAVGETTQYGIHVPGAEEYFSVGALVGNPEWPSGRIVCYAVVGGSEGSYVHVDVLKSDGRYRHMITGKTFEGLEAATALATKLTIMFAELDG